MKAQSVAPALIESQITIFFYHRDLPQGSDSSTALLREPEFCAGFRRYKYGAIASGTSNALPPAQLCVPEQLWGEVG
jgi:hypothetical protein